ncbi:TPA: hypothetical protein NV922_001324 [Escherichia coli]|nr:hypothetical protein [Escherichia coli]
MSNYYVSGCVANGDDVSTCDDSVAQFWTLYHRNDDGLSEGIIDCIFREDAEAAMRVYEQRDALAADAAQMISELRDQLEAAEGLAEFRGRQNLATKEKLDALLGGFEEAIRHKDKLASELNAMAAENAYLLPKAASELSNAWMLNKYWVGIHAALMHMKVGRIHDAEQWLKNTIAGPGIEAPNFKLTEEIEAWATEQSKDSISHSRALQIIKTETPATAAYLNSVRAEGIHFAANRMLAAWESGFIDDTPAQVHDISGAVLSALEFLPNASPEEFKRDYADEVRSAIAAKLRAGKDGE